MKIFHKLLGSLLAVCMAAQMLAVPAFAAEDQEIYLALGDSISTGYGLSNNEKSFVDQVGEKLPGYTVMNEAVSGFTAVDVVNLVSGGKLDAAISSASLITITCGGNDMMHTLYQQVATEFNASYSDKAGATISATEVPKYLTGEMSFPKSPAVYKLRLTSVARKIVGGEDLDNPGDGFSTSPAFHKALENFSLSITSMMKAIRTLNPTAHVIINTQYNPYKAFEKLDASVYDSMYRSISAEIVPCLDALNEVIFDNAVELGYIVSDVRTAFEPYNGSVCNAAANGSDPDLDFHPNAAGHTVIADTIMDTIEKTIDIIAPIPQLVSADLSKGTVTFTGSGIYVYAAAAFYDADGRMVAYRMQAMNGSEEETTLKASIPSGSSAQTAKIFFFNRGTLIPDGEVLLVTENK